MSPSYMTPWSATQTNKRLKGTTARDILFFLFIVGFPSNMFGFVNPDWFYVQGLFDYQMIVILIFAVISVGMALKVKTLLEVPSGKWLLLLAIFLIFNYLASAIRSGPYDAFIVFRYYCLPIVAIGPMLVLTNSSPDRQRRFLRWAFIATIVQAFLYILYCAGVPLFFAPTYISIYRGYGGVSRNFLAFPVYTLLVLGVSFSFAIHGRRPIYFLLVGLLFIVMIVSTVRFYLIQTAVVILVISMLALYKRWYKSVVRLGIVSIVFIVSMSAVLILYPHYFQYISERFMEISGFSWQGLNNAPDFKGRVLYMNVSLYEIHGLKDLLVGHGYKKLFMSDWIKGNYTTGLATQIDAPLAGLIYTEGIVGVFLRVLPFIVLLFGQIKLLKKSRASWDIMISSVIVAMIVATGIGALQTPDFNNVTWAILPYILLSGLGSNAVREAERFRNEACFRKTGIYTTPTG